MQGEQPLCFECKHFNPDSSLPYTCKAFPGGIPVQIMASQWSHRTPIKGDNGIQFEPATKNSLGSRLAKAAGRLRGKKATPE